MTDQERIERAVQEIWDREKYDDISDILSRFAAEVRKEGKKRLQEALRIIVWMSGSDDFSRSGKAAKGWERLQPALDRLFAVVSLSTPPTPEVREQERREAADRAMGCPRFLTGDGIEVFRVDEVMPAILSTPPTPEEDEPFPSGAVYDGVTVNITSIERGTIPPIDDLPTPEGQEGWECCSCGYSPDSSKHPLYCPGCHGYLWDRKTGPLPQPPEGEV